MDTIPLISIVVPVFNVEQTLNRCLDSIIAQTYKRLEIVLVDDGSVDYSGKICDQYGQRDNRIQVIHTSNHGLAEARKLGVHASGGDYIGFVDSDDYIDANTYELMYTKTENGTVDIVGCGCWVEGAGEVYRTMNLAGAGVYEGKGLEELRERMMFDMQRGVPGVFQSACCKLFRRELLTKIMDSIDVRITVGEDAALVYPFLLEARKAALSDSCLYHYVIRNNSMTRVSDISIFERIYTFYQYMDGCFMKYAESYKLKKQLNRYLVHLIDMGMANSYGIRHKQIKAIRLDPMIYGKKIILYGAGMVGKKYYRNILEREDIEVIAWVDKNPILKQVYGRQIQGPEIIKEVDFDYVLIAVGSSDMADAIKGELKKICDYETMLWFPQCVQYNGEFEFLNEM